jgi:hypothetical protein
MAASARRDPATGETVVRRKPGRARLAISDVFTHVEDAVYLALGVLLAASAGASLVNGAVAFWDAIRGGAALRGIVEVLDRILLVLMIIELLYTVKVSFREHTLVPEPFLIVGLIAATRRILVVTAQFAVLLERPSETVFRAAMIELGLLTLMVVALVVSLRILRQRAAPAAESG